MLPLVLLALAASVIGVAVVLGATVLRVALAGPPAMSVRGAPWPTWQPPPIHNDELLAWATAAARGEVRARVARFRGARLAREVALAVQAGTRRAIGSSPFTAAPPAEHACSSCRHHQLAVTPPEVFAIAEALRQQPFTVQRQTARRAAENNQRIRSLSAQAFEASGIECPLLLNGLLCAAHSCRPLQCRGWMRRTVTADSREATRPADTSLDAHARTVSRGAQAGLMQELSAAGLDAGRYELNSALVVALDASDAAERWSRGEAVFAACQRCDA